MADENNTPTEDEDELLLDEELEPGDGDQTTDEVDGEEGDEDEETVLTFGDEPAQEQPTDSNLVKHLRGLLRSEKAKTADLAKRAPAAQPIVVGDKPTMESCDYDEEKFETELDAWKQRKADAAEQTKQAEASTETEQQAWQQDFVRYEEAKGKLGFADVQEAEDTALASFTQGWQPAALIRAVEGDPAKVIYALAKNPERLTALAAINDPLKFAAAVARLEGQLKMVKRKKTAAEPEKIERGSAKVGTVSSDKKLKKLEEEADRTGDRTELIRYRKQQRDAGK